MARNFRKINAWRLADDLVILVYEVTSIFPKHEMFALTSQMRRAAISAAANIAEGSARESKKHYLHFLNIAEASLIELQYYFHLTYRLNYITKEIYDKLIKGQIEATFTLRGLMFSVRSEVNQGL